MAVHNFYKPLGGSPLDCIKQLKRLHPELMDAPMTYAGRLDPMAEGVIVFLSGEDRHRKEEFQNLPKTYQATFLFGLSSDTYDALGVIQQGNHAPKEKIENVLNDLTGSHSLPFPPFSSYKIKGKPLHWWALENKLSEIDIPLKEMVVTHQSEPIPKTQTLSRIRAEALQRIQLVKGNFRQSQVTQSWNDLNSPTELYTTASITLEVTSGTYIRSLAQMMGTQLTCGALLLSLKRTAVANYAIKDSEQHIETNSSKSS